MNKNNKLALIIILTIIITLLTITLLSTKKIITYGEIKGNQLITEVIDCELDYRNYFIINLLPAQGKYRIEGITVYNLILIQSLNETYEPGIECFEHHKEDIILDIAKFTIKSNEGIRIEYTVNNQQDKRLFYESTLTLDCVIQRNYYTGYINPATTAPAYFNITCTEGIHEGSVRTVFVDELRNYHETTQEITVTAQ